MNNLLSFKFAGIGQIGITLLIMYLFFAFGGCERSKVHSDMVHSSSVSKLLSRLENLKQFDIKSCKFTIKQTRVKSRVPSPSDTKIEFIGSANLSEEGYKLITTQFDWKPIARDKIPKSLLLIVPDTDLFFSSKINDSFSKNVVTYCHGFIVITAKEDCRNIFFLSTDLDHPIELE